MSHKVVLRTLLGLIVASLVTLGLLHAEKAAGGWTQFGGPNRDFKISGSSIADTWPDSGPTRLWERELGEGYSGILIEGNKLYTMYRGDGKEVIACLNAKTGETHWEHSYDSAPKEGHITQFGEGPRATPLIDGNTLYTIGVSGVMHAVNKTNGKVLWSQDLWGEEFGGNFLNHGYSSSPIAYKNTVIALVGGEGASIVAFNKKDGKVAWKKHSFENSYSSPRLLNVDGEQQLIAFMAHELVGVDPDNGDLRWEYKHENQWLQNINVPVMADKNHLFLSSPQAGARGLKLTRDGDKTNVEEIWSTRKIQFYHVTSVRNGDWVYGSTGTQAPCFMAAVNIKTGEIAWRKRGMAKANVVEVGGKLIALDEDGKLYLTTATPEDLQVHSAVQVLERVAWTAPTVVGKTMYLRDKNHIVALDLG